VLKAMRWFYAVVFAGPLAVLAGVTIQPGDIVLPEGAYTMTVDGSAHVSGNLIDVDMAAGNYALSVADPNEPPPPPPPPPDPVPGNDAEMISAILAMAPEQHPTEARFVKIPGSEIDVLVGSNEFPFCDWTGGAWNFDDWEFANPAGGGHGDYGGNELYVANLLATDGELSVKWSRPLDPHPLQNEGGACGPPTVGPVASHTYASVLWINKQREYFHLTTGGWPATTACQGKNADGIPKNANISSARGAWTTDKASWTRRNGGAHDYPRAFYDRTFNKVVLFGQTGSGDIAIYDADNNYAVTIQDRSQWFSGAGAFDSAYDINKRIGYFYHNQTGVEGWRYNNSTGRVGRVFAPIGPELVVHSLSVEQSTGDLVIVNASPKGQVKIIRPDTRQILDVSATDGSGIPPSTAVGNLVFGKFDMIEKMPCVGVGMADPRNGVFLMTLPANICTMAVAEPVPEPNEPPPVASSPFIERCKDNAVVFCDPLSTTGPYSKDENGDLVVLTNPDGSQGVPSKTWWRQWRGVQQFGANGEASARYDPVMDALKVVMPPNHASSGLFTTNFSKNLRTQFKDGDTFRIEFQVRYNCDFIYTDCDSSSPSYKTDRRPIVNEDGTVQGSKLAIVGEGDAVVGESANACVVIQLVPYGNTGHTLGVFHNCGKYQALRKWTGKIIGGSSQYDWQSGGDYSCLWMPDDQTRAFASWKAGGTGPNCAQFEPDQWMTFAMTVTIGEWQRDWTGPKKSRVKMELGYEGQPLKTVFDMPAYLSPPDSRYIGYGKIWLQFHSTKAKPGDRPEYVAWYRNLIVSKVI